MRPEVSTQIEFHPLAVKIGEYEISPFDDNSVWIRHESGEGMQVDNSTLAEVIDKFYRETF